MDSVERRAAATSLPSTSNGPSTHEGIDPGSLLPVSWNVRNESMKNRGEGARIMQRRACWGVGRLICQAAPSALPSRSTLRPAWQARGLVWSQLRPVGVALTVGHARGFHSTLAGFQAGGEDDALHSRSENRAPAAHTNGQRHSELQVRCHAMTSCFPRECLGIRAHLHMHRGAMPGRRDFPGHDLPLKPGTKRRSCLSGGILASCCST